MALLLFRLLIFPCKAIAPNFYYLQSSRISWKSPIKPLLTGLPWVILLAALYVLVIRYNPFIYFSFIATAWFAALVGIGANFNTLIARYRTSKDQEMKKQKEWFLERCEKTPIISAIRFPPPRSGQVCCAPAKSCGKRCSGSRSLPKNFLNFAC